jgi:hypothetical protein
MANTRASLITELVRIIEELGADRKVVSFLHEGCGFFSDVVMVEILQKVKDGKWDEECNDFAVSVIQR